MDEVGSKYHSKINIITVEYDINYNRDGINKMIDQRYDINIETTVISSIIFDPSILKKYSTKLNTDLFYNVTYKKIIAVILDLYKNDKIIDENIIRNRLGREYEDEIISILTVNPAHNLDSYLEILNDYAIKREMSSFALDIRKDIDANISGVELQAKIANKAEKLSSSHSIEIFEIENIDKIEDREVDFICKEWLPIPTRTVSLLTAPGGTGKSWFVMQLAMRAINEGKIKKAFLWLSEDPKEITKNRFNKIYDKVLKIDNKRIREQIDISDSPTIQFIYEEQRKVEVSPLFTHFKAKLSEYDFIILDPLIAFYGTDENNNASARKFMQLFTDWANKENKTIIFIHHSTKNTTQSRGASAFVDAVRSVYEIDKIKDKDGNNKETNKRVVKLTKDNYGISNLLNGFEVEREIFPAKEFTEIVYQSKSLIDEVGNEMKYSMPTDF